MKVLMVRYLPRENRSRTKKLYDAALEILKAKGVLIDVVDLTQKVPDLFLPDRLSAYYRRNYGGEKLSAAQSKLMAGMDQLTEQLKKADLVIVAYPMHNFSQPAIMKAWFDAVMLKGETWDIGKEGYIGLMKGKKALVLSSSGGVYEGDLAFMEHSASLSKVHFMFMGYESDAVVAAGLNRFPEKEAEILAEAQKKIKDILDRWI